MDTSTSIMKLKNLQNFDAKKAFEKWNNLK